MDKWKEKFYVPSSSGEAVYTVGLSHSGDWACGCIGWTRHVPRKDCKHIRAIKAEQSQRTAAMAAIVERFRRPPLVMVSGRSIRMINLPD